MQPHDYCQSAFLERLMRAHASERNIRVEAVQPLPLDNSASILAVLTAGQSARPIGHYGLAVTFVADGQRQTRKLVLKLKPAGREVSDMLMGLAQACGGELAACYPAYATRTGFYHTHRRELDVYEQYAPELMATVWGLHRDEAGEVYAILMDYLDEVELLNSVMQPGQWTDEHLRAALTQLAAWHAEQLVPAGAVGTLVARGWSDLPSAAYMQQLAPLWQALLANAARHFPSLYDAERTQQLARAIADIPDYWSELTTLPKTLIHNDLNPRNTCFRRTPEGLQFCAYDWELATYHVPQYDVVELLAFTLGPDRYHLRRPYLEYYRQQLHARTGQHADAEAFERTAGLAALDFGLYRLGMYLMAHTVSPYPFLPRVVESYFDTLKQLQVAAAPVLG